MSDHASAAEAELVEWVEPDGSVIEIVTRARMRAEHLRHRCVYIVVCSADDAVLVHRRAEWKDVFPGAWDLAFGGVCDPGEEWPTAAARELLEEAGVVDAELVDHGDVAYEADDVALVGRLYSTVSAGPFAFNDGEVTAVEWVPRAELAAWAAERVVPDDTRAIVLPAILDWA